MTATNGAPVVITGVGAVTPLGVGAELLYKRWCAGEVGITDGVGRCGDFTAADHFARRELRTTDRFTQLAVVAVEEALAQAGWERRELPYAPERIGVVIASSMGGLDSLYTQHARWRDRPRSLSPFTAVMFMPNAAASVVAHRWGFRGETCAVVSACASGTTAYGTAIRLLDENALDAVVIGGADAPLSGPTLDFFDIMGALSKSGVARPFDRGRDGFVLGEGAGAAVVERAENARRRGAPVLGEIAGFGASTDAFDMSAPDPTGRSAAHAIRTALATADCEPSDVCYVNSHGTGSQYNDVAETNALKLAFGDAAWGVPISSTKSTIGHLMGGAGMVEGISTLLALRDGVAPPTLGLSEPDDGLDLNYVPGVAQAMPAAGGKARIAISNSFGLGGNNAVVALRVA